MSQMTDYMENKLADFFRGQGLTLPSNWYIAGGSAASDSTFTELTGIGLSRVSVARSMANWAGTQGDGTTVASTGTSHASSNNNDVVLGAPTGSGTLNYVGFFDASSSGNCWMYFPVTPVSISSGSPASVKVLAGALRFSLGKTGGCSDYLANKLIDKIFRGQTFDWPTIYRALFTSAPTNAGGGTEVSAAGYARVAIVPGTSTLSGTQSVGSTTASSGTAGRISNNLESDNADPTADWGTLVAEALLDASSSGNLLMWGLLVKSKSDLTPTPKTVSNGDPAPTHAPDSIGITVA